MQKAKVAGEVYLDLSMGDEASHKICVEEFDRFLSFYKQKGASFGYTSTEKVCWHVNFIIAVFDH